MASNRRNVRFGPTRRHRQRRSLAVLQSSNRNGDQIASANLADQAKLTGAASPVNGIVKPAILPIEALQRSFKESSWKNARVQSTSLSVTPDVVPRTIQATPKQRIRSPRTIST